MKGDTVSNLMAFHVGCLVDVRSLGVFEGTHLQPLGVLALPLIPRHAVGYSGAWLGLL